ncbi:MAG TPA: electron transfer flavoprotein subunit beta/FixA family protein [Acidobacteriaceae bacterium]|nr:electron transfer flavoprotein subunit beta/FixA family protein [Acidobacteriaceae bacterium]
MKILVAMRQVPERDAALAIAAGAGWIEDSALSYSTNEPDAYALEEALRLKDSLAPAAGEVIALTAGPERAASVLRDALARGADRALHIVTQSGPPQHDPLPLAHLLAAAVRAESPDLILTGLQSDDLGLGQTGVILAELLGIPHTTLGLHVETVASGIRVKRELEDGWFQHVEMALPALVTIQSGGNQLRYATLMGIKKARTKELREMDAAELTASAPAQSIELVRVFLPEKQRQTHMLTGTSAEIAMRLVDVLRNEVRVL